MRGCCGIRFSNPIKELAMKQNVIVALFEVSSEAYQAFSELKAYVQTADTLIAQVALVKKENGLLIPVEGSDFTADIRSGAWTGGLVGALIGVLGGPLGVLLGGTVGSVIGHDAGAAKTLGEAGLLEITAQKLDDGSTAVILLAQENSEAPLDQFFGRFQTTVARWDAAAVQQELAAAVETQAELARQAHEAWEKQKTDEFKGKVEQFKTDIKQEFDKLASKLHLK